MAQRKTGGGSAMPHTSGSGQQKSRPATSFVGSGDEGSSAPRIPPVPVNTRGPGGRRPTWTPRKKTADTANGGNDSNSRGSRPAAAAGARSVSPRGGARGPGKIPPGEGQPAPPLPVPEKAYLMERRTVEEVERQTRGQRQNPNWHSWRQNRITASMAHQVAHSRFANGHDRPPPASYLRAITGETRGMKTRAMAWGIDNEHRAAGGYQRLKSRSLGRRVRVRDCGLFIHPERPWLAGSPDGIVEDAETGERLLCLEIKCPYKHRSRTVAEACAEDRHFCLELRPEAGEGGSPYRLKTKHPYYTQVQCQMAVVGLHKADFVVFTLREIAIVPVTFDPELWKSTEAKLQFFYTNAVLPYMHENGKGAPLLRREE